jgi:hypothetical protein
VRREAQAALEAPELAVGVAAALGELRRDAEMSQPEVYDKTRNALIPEKSRSWVASASALTAIALAT